MTTDRDGNRSNPYKPNPAACCIACVFGSGDHAPWCELSQPKGPVFICTQAGNIYVAGVPRARIFYG